MNRLVGWLVGSLVLWLEIWFVKLPGYSEKLSNRIIDYRMMVCPCPGVSFVVCTMYAIRVERTRERDKGVSGFVLEFE